MCCRLGRRVVAYIGDGNGPEGYRSGLWNVIIRHGNYVVLYGHMEAPETNTSYS